MATSRTTVIQSLSIALIVFVMLTFILAVTTYFFYAQGVLESANTKKAEDALREKGDELAKVRDEKERLQKILGFKEEQAFDEVTAETTQTLETTYGDYLKNVEGSYQELVKRLKESADEKDKAVIALEKEKQELAAQKDADIKAREEQVAAVEKEIEAVKAAAAADQEKLKQAIDENERQRQDLAKKYDEALAQSADFERLRGKVAEGEPLLSAGRQSRFKTQSAEDRVAAMMDELRERERAIARADEALATLRATDPAVQDAVLAAIPKDDRIDGFDGRIVSVNDVDRTVLILADSTRGIRPGLLLSVYDPVDPTPAIDASKGKIEVIGIESPTLVRARILHDEPRDPILGGDGVATSLWAPGETFEAVILGFVQIDRDERPDADRLQELIESVGGTVATAVSPQTTLVVDAGAPKAVGSERAAGWRPADDQRREKQLKEARRLGLKVVGLDRFLRMMGLERDSLDANRLPTVGADRPVEPTR